MGNLDFSANADQLKELAAYMASQINVPTIGIGGGYAPIGTIISVMGTTAPQDYLACDGTAYNIADYPQLADYFESQFGESNHFGGDGTTTFAVPDLQGEFLRGTGTNSHTNQGSGAAVGVHQDGTEHGLIYGNTVTIAANTSDSNTIIFPDKISTDVAEYNKRYIDGSGLSGNGSYYTSRPTNTSVLYCIKAVVAGEVYSTEERVVGTWIDGKKLYQKVVTGSSPSAANSWQQAVLLGNTCVIQNCEGILFFGTNNERPLPWANIVWFKPNNPNNGSISMYLNGNELSDYFNKTCRFIVQYTKTTDG